MNSVILEIERKMKQISAYFYLKWLRRAFIDEWVVDHSSW